MIIMERIALMTLGERVKSYRTAQGLTQAQLARLSTLHPTEISRLEADLIPGVSARKLSQLAEALGVTTSHLLGEVPFLATWPDSDGV